MGDLDRNTGVGGLGAGLAQVSQSPAIQAPKQPGAFRRILGSMAGIAGSVFAPGLGGALGGIIGGQGAGNQGALNTLLSQQQAAFNDLLSQQIAGNAENAREAQLQLQVVQAANRQQEQVETVSNLEKSKHSTLMSVIQNIGN